MRLSTNGYFEAHSWAKGANSDTYGIQAQKGSGGRIEILAQDWRFAFRMVRKSPAFSLVVIVTLALGIGASTLIFSVVNAVLLRPLPFRGPDRLLVVWENDLKHGQQQFDVSRLDYDDWLQQNHVFSEMAIYTDAGVSLTGGAAPERLVEHGISASFFPLLGIAPLAGRTFTPAEDTAGGPPVALISERLWRRRFGADPGAVGGDLLDDFERIGDAARPECIPDAVNLIANFTGKDRAK